MARQEVEIDSAVASILQDSKARTRRRRMPRAQRCKAERDARRSRVTWEINPHVDAMVRQIAEAEGCSPAGAVNLLVVDAVERYVVGDLEFAGHRRQSRSPRYDFVIELNGKVSTLLERVRRFIEESRGG